MTIQAAKGWLAMSHVLLIEDEFQLRRIMTLNLAHEGHSVAETDSLETAFDMLLAARQAGKPFDLIVLELRLPDGCGWDLLRMLRSLPSASEPDAPNSTPAVVISKTTGDEDKCPRCFPVFYLSGRIT